MKETTVYTMRTDAVRERDCALLARRMPERVQKAMRYRFERDRLLCLGAGLLMMEALDVRDEREIRYGANGKPYLPGGPAFNLSHSGSVCILAFGPAGQIGADIEKIDERHIDVAPEIYTADELAWMKADPVNRFFMLWTWKESVMKAAGVGMIPSLKRLEVLPFANGDPVRSFGRDWYAKGDRLDDSFFCVCADEPIHRLVRIDCG